MAGTAPTTTTLCCCPLLPLVLGDDDDQLLPTTTTRSDKQHVFLQRSSPRRRKMVVFSKLLFPIDEQSHTYCTKPQQQLLEDTTSTEPEPFDESNHQNEEEKTQDVVVSAVTVSIADPRKLVIDELTNKLSRTNRLQEKVIETVAQPESVDEKTVKETPSTSSSSSSCSDSQSSMEEADEQIIEAAALADPTHPPSSRYSQHDQRTNDPDNSISVDEEEEKKDDSHDAHVLLSRIEAESRKSSEEEMERILLQERGVDEDDTPVKSDAHHQSQQSLTETPVIESAKPVGESSQSLSHQELSEGSQVDFASAKGELSKIDTPDRPEHASELIDNQQHVVEELSNQMGASMASKNEGDASFPNVPDPPETNEQTASCGSQELDMAASVDLTMNDQSVVQTPSLSDSSDGAAHGISSISLLPEHGISPKNSSELAASTSADLSPALSPCDETQSTALECGPSAEFSKESVLQDEIPTSESAEALQSAPSDSEATTPVTADCAPVSELTTKDQSRTTDISLASIPSPDIAPQKADEEGKDSVSHVDSVGRNTQNDFNTLTMNGEDAVHSSLCATAASMDNQSSVCATAERLIESTLYSNQCTTADETNSPETRNDFADHSSGCESSVRGCLSDDSGVLAASASDSDGCMSPLSEKKKKSFFGKLKKKLLPKDLSPSKGIPSPARQRSTRESALDSPLMQPLPPPVPDLCNRPQENEGSPSNHAESEIPVAIMRSQADLATMDRASISFPLPPQAVDTELSIVRNPSSGPAQLNFINDSILVTPASQTLSRSGSMHELASPQLNSVSPHAPKRLTVQASIEVAHVFRPPRSSSAGSTPAHSRAASPHTSQGPSPGSSQMSTSSSAHSQASAQRPHLPTLGGVRESYNLPPQPRKESATRAMTRLIRKDLWSNDPSQVEAALRYLADVASDPDKVTLIARTGGLLAIVNCMEQHTLHAGIQIAACNALEKLALDSDNELAIGEVGGVEAIQGAMMTHFGDTNVQEAAWSALWNLTCGNADCSSLNHSGLVACMTRHIDDAQVQRNACGTLANLCLDNDERLTSLAHAGGFVAIATALEKFWREEDVKSEAAHALVQLLGHAAETYEVPANHIPISASEDWSEH